MTVTHKITNMELTGRGRPYQIHAKQGDTNTRVVEISLYANNTPFQPPDGTNFVVRFRKQDGTSGMYDTMPDGTTPAATAEANLLTVNLAPQMLTCPGKVQCDVALVNGTDLLATFDFWLIVDPSPSEGTDTGSQNYYRVQTLDELNAVLDSFEQEILTKSGGQPVPVTSASEMVDTGTIYLYLGNEDGYAYGYIYVYQNGAWESTELYGRGQDGKSAYAYAVEGGYTGTETEFAAKLAEETHPGAYPVVNMTANTAELAPNTYYRWGEISALTITLGAEIAGITNEYCFEFVSGETATTLTVPDTIAWAQEPSIEAGKTYQGSILNGIGVIYGA